MSRRVERVGLAHVEIPFKTAPSHAGENAPVRASILVAVETDDGVIGLGECAPPIRVGLKAAVAQCWNALAETVLPTILGKSFEDLEDVEAAHRCWPGVPASASAGAETALWDLVGQQARVPLSEMLGASPMRIEAGVESGLVLDLAPTVTDLLRAAESHLEEGYRRLTVAIAPGRDLGFVEAVRRSHPDLPLAIDAGQRFSRSDTTLFRRIDELMPLWISEPWPRDDLDGLKALQAELMNPISLDSMDDEAIQSGACRVARLSIQTAGGFGPARKRHDFCARHGVDCWVGTAPELGVGQSQAVHLATLSNCKDATDAAPPIRWLVDDVVVPAIEFDEPGRFLVSSRPGLGHLLDPLKVRRYQVRYQEWTVGEQGA